MSQFPDGQAIKVILSFKLEDGTVVPTSQDGGPIDMVVGQSCGIAAIDTALAEMAAGESRTFQLQPEEAFGMPDPNKIMELERNVVEGEVQPGMALQMQDPEGNVVPAIVHDVSETSIVVNANHPLAGEVLDVSLELVGQA